MSGLGAAASVIAMLHPWPGKLLPIGLRPSTWRAARQAELSQLVGACLCRVDTFVRACLEIANATRGNDIIVTMGADFWYGNGHVM
jgi:hypothetical protein